MTLEFWFKASLSRHLSLGYLHCVFRVISNEVFIIIQFQEDDLRGNIIWANLLLWVFLNIAFMLTLNMCLCMCVYALYIFSVCVHICLCVLYKCWNYSCQLSSRINRNTDITAHYYLSLFQAKGIWCYGTLVILFNSLLEYKLKYSDVFWPRRYSRFMP